MLHFIPLSLITSLISDSDFNNMNSFLLSHFNKMNSFTYVLSDSSSLECFASNNPENKDMTPKELIKVVKDHN